MCESFGDQSAAIEACFLNGENYTAAHIHMYPFGVRSVREPTNHAEMWLKALQPFRRHSSATLRGFDPSLRWTRIIEP